MNKQSCSDVGLDGMKKGEKVKVYLRQSINVGYFMVADYALSSSDCVALGEGEVSFTFYEDEKIISEAMNSIDAQIKQVRAKAQMEINQLEDRRADLLSLTHQKSDDEQARKELESEQ
jgi:hypothetical protein